MQELTPFISLLDQDEKTVMLEDYHGKWVILYTYPKDDTPACTNEACSFTQVSAELLRLDVCILGISPDSPESHRKFIAKYDLKIRLLSDPQSHFLKKLGSYGLKKSYGREFEGVIRSTFLINPSGKIVREWKNVKVKGHVQKVVFQTKEILGCL